MRSQNQETLKQKVAQATIHHITSSIIGLGSGSTINYFITILPRLKKVIKGVVAASLKTEKYLTQYNIPILDLNHVLKLKTNNTLDLYIDSTDEVNQHLQLIKGRGGALTREKIIASASKKFICIADETKLVNHLGQKTSLPIEVLPMSQNYISREIAKLGGFSILRENCITDNGNIILDVYNLDFTDPIKLEGLLNNIPGVVCNGLFAQRPADKLLLATKEGIKFFEKDKARDK